MALYAKISCSLPADEAVMAAGDLAELVYIRSILFCREHLTDGVIRTNQLRRVCIGIRGKPETHAGALVDAGLWESRSDGWAIPIDLWREWNPLASEVDAKRAEEAQRKKSYRDKVRVSRECPSGTDSDAWDTRKQPEPEPEIRKESSSVLTVVPASTQDDDAEDFEYVVGQIVAAKELEYRPRKPRPWRLATRRNTIAEDGDLIRRELDNGLDREHVALMVLGYGTSAAKERTETAWCDEDCEHGCEGDGWTRTDEGFAPCPGR